MRQAYNKFLNFKVSQLFKWIFFIPVSLIVYWVSTFTVYIGVNFLFHFLSQLRWYFLIPAIFPAFAIIAIITGGLWSCFYIGLSLSPNKIFCWLLTTWFAFSALSSVPEYCTPIQLSKDAIIIQLPCWAYIILQLYIVICLIVAAIIVSINIENKFTEIKTSDEKEEKDFSSKTKMSEENVQKMKSTFIEALKEEVDEKKLTK